MKHLYTTLGPKTQDELGLILPHEHVFVDLRTPDTPGYAQAETQDVVALMAPEIEKLKELGFSALVECSTCGVGRRPDIDLAVSKATNFPIVVPTGIYREPWIPEWAKTASVEEIRDWMIKELEEQIDGADFRAAWIKISAGDDGLTDLEKHILRAAAQAGKATNAVIGSHTIKGSVVMDQLDIIEEEGYTPSRFISIHTQLEPDFELQKAVAGRGAWIEYDNAGWVPDEEILANIMRALEAGLSSQMLISHDAGWYDPAKPGGGEPKPYTVVPERILPKLRGQGVGDAMIGQLMRANPFNAYAR